MMVQSMLETDTFKSLINFFTDFKTLAALDFKREGNILVDSATLQQFKILEDDTEVAAQMRDASGTVAGDIASIDEDLATGWTFRTIE